MATLQRIQLEICIASARDAELAEKGGANRLEVNSALALGGLTPTLGLIREIQTSGTLPLIVMLRPRAGGFAYDASDYRVLLRDLDLFLEAGVQQFAIGLLTPDGEVDRVRCQEVRQRAGHSVLVFHRAFDVVPKPFEAMEQLIDLGFRRIMTSGQEESAYNGSHLIAQLIQRSAGRIEILPAGGINRFTLADVVARTGCDQVHASLQHSLGDSSTRARPQISFGSRPRILEDTYTTTNLSAVEEMVQLLDRVQVE